MYVVRLGACVKFLNHYCRVWSFIMLINEFFFFLASANHVSPLLSHLMVVKVEDWLERLVEEKGEDLYRMKGVLAVDGSEQRYVFQVLFYNIVILPFYCLFAIPNLLNLTLLALLPYFGITTFRGCIPCWMTAQEKHGNPMKRG